MCGIAGILQFDDSPVDAAALRRMRQRLERRGPDTQGEFLSAACGLAHRRLSVLDLTSGAQPMTRGSLSVVFNGEIYNHRDLRRELESLGHVFSSDHSDTEALLHGYKQWGADLPRRLEGMFAFALWDASQRQLFLARDRAGEKPLMMHRDGRRFTFASTVAALIAGLEGAPEVDHDAVEFYLAYGYTDERSLLRQITELPAAHWATVQSNGRFHCERYWSAPPLEPESDRWQVEDLESLLRVAVERRLETDVPIGCFLSGGIDSSLVAHFAQQSLRKSGGKLRTFCVSMPDARYDESPWARQVADHLGTDHVQLRAEPRIEEDLRLLIHDSGQPLGDSSILPTYWISRAARQQVTVALSGDGGDELFGGYDRYRAMRLIQRHRWWIRWLPKWRGSDGKSWRNRLGRLIAAARRADPASQYESIVQLMSGHAASSLEFESDLDPVDAARRWDFARYLPFDLLRKVDRASMAVGLEVRCPLLDTPVIEAALRRPFTVVCPGGRLKGLLRDLAARHLPAPVAQRGKMGFSLPLARWFRTTLLPFVRQWLLETSLEPWLDRPELEGIIDQHTAGRADHSQRLFALVCLAIWLAEARRR